MGRKKKEHDINNIINNDDKIARSNKLITAKFTSTLIENKLTVWAMKAATVDDKGRPSVSIKASDVRELTGVKGGGIYNILKETSKKMTGRTIYYEDTDSEGKKSFKYINMIHYCEYKDGVFTVTFTPECCDLLYNLKGNFTSLSLTTLFSLKSNSSYRLFEILSVNKYLIDNTNNPVPIVFPLSVLKLELNCIDTEEAKVKKELMKSNPDYDKIVNELAYTNKFATWSDFKNKVLKPAIKEINQKTDLYVDFEPIKHGRGGKVNSVKFFIQRNNGQNELIFGDVVQPDTHVDKVLTTEEMERSRLIPLVQEILSPNSLGQKDIISLLKAADNQIDKIKKAYELSTKQGYIKNLTAWMIAAIRGEYEEPVPSYQGSQEQARIVDEIKQKVDSASEEDKALVIWNRVKQNESFPDFVNYIQSVEGIPDLEYFEMFHPDVKERNLMFFEWMRNGK